MKIARCLILLGALMGLLVGTQVAQANSAPPPRRIWFVFADGKLPAAMQVIGCSDAACSEINLLREYGRCESANCIDSPQVLNGPSDYFDCAEGRCLFASYAELPPFIQLAAQLSDASEASSPAVPISTTERWDSNVLRVAVQGEQLQLTSEANATAPSVGKLGQVLPWLGPSGLLTLVVEIVTSALLLVFVFKQPTTSLLGWVVMIGVANLLSYPATWLFFPNFGAWAIPGERLVGVLALFLAVLMAALLVSARHAQRRGVRITLGVIAGVLLVLGCVGSLPALMLSGYGQYLPGAAGGLSFGWVLLLAEGFAVIFETIFIYWLSKRQLGLPRTATMVLAANVASFAIGWLAFSPVVLR